MSGQAVLRFEGHRSGSYKKFGVISWTCEEEGGGGKDLKGW